jgi:hypothetical protein
MPRRTDANQSTVPQNKAKLIWDSVAFVTERDRRCDAGPSDTLVKVLTRSFPSPVGSNIINHERSHCKSK